MLLALLLDIARAEVYAIRENGGGNLALTITDDNVGFRKYDPSADEQKIEVTDEDEIMRNGKRVCTSPSTANVVLCSSKHPIEASFRRLEHAKMYMFRIRGDYVLAVGDYNMNTGMWNAKIVPQRTAERGERYMFLLTPKPGRGAYQGGRSWRRQLKKSQ